MAAPAQTTITFAVWGPIARSDLPGLCDRICALLSSSDARVALCDVRGVEPHAVTVDALARLQLANETLRESEERLRTVFEAAVDGIVELDHDDVISILFTATPDLVSEFPALAARELGMGDVPLMCATEIDVAHALPRVLRLMAHVETDRPRADIQHVYLRGAVALRKDIAQ